MEAALALRSPSSLQAFPPSPFADGPASSSLSLPFLSAKARLAPPLSLKTGFIGRSVERGISGRKQKHFRISCARADSSNDGGAKPIAPMLPESPTGQLLVQLLQSHPHLVPAAAEQQLEKLAEDRDVASNQEQPTPAGTELVLYRRIAELKAQERRKVLEEIMYALIVQKFVESGVSMVPKIASTSQTKKVDSWPLQFKELESVHSLEALEMINEHLALVLGGRGISDYSDESTVAQISKLRVGQVYAASIMYGYFLRRVDRRFQLEKSMKMLPPGLEGEEVEQAGAVQEAEDGNSQQERIAEEVAAAVAAYRGAGGMKDFNSDGFGPVGMKASKLRAYVTSFDSETLQRCATIRSKESVSVIEKHTEALFGRPEIQIAPDGTMAIAKDEIIRLSLAGLKRLVLEAVAFGSFLWDVETYVDSRYTFVAH